MTPQLTRKASGDSLHPIERHVHAWISLSCRTVAARLRKADVVGVRGTVVPTQTRNRGQTGPQLTDLGYVLGRD